MFKVNLTTSVLEKIAVDVKRPAERIGVLIGNMLDDGLWVTDIVPGDTETDATSCVFTTAKLAKVADDILNGRIDGKIVGWYHSHPGHGLFMSETDSETQNMLLQFSPFVIAMVVEPTTNEFGIWVYDADSGLVSLPLDYLRIV